MNQEIIKKLQAPFPFDEVEAKVQVTNADKTKGMCVFYLDSRAVQKRLDETLGPNNWKNHYYPWQDKAQICGLSIYDEGRGEWIEKQDGAENSEIEAIKGGLTDSFKRAAVVWGVGRYLYEMDGVWADVEVKGKSTVIKQDQHKKLEAAYNAAVARIFGGGATANNGSGTSGSAVPAKQVPAKPAATNDAAQQAPQAKQSTPADEYTVKSVKPSGKTSQVLELIDNVGEVTTAYVRNSDDAIKNGTRLHKVSMTRRESSYGPYTVLDAYQMAA